MPSSTATPERSDVVHLLLGAQSCGFGPISKLAALSRLLPEHHRVFAGTTVAVDFARRNSDAFDEILETSSPDALTALIAGCDHVVSVMDADLVLRAVVAGRPALLVDSLFGFWQLQREPAEIAELCERAPRTDFAALDAHLAVLSPHERIYAAHLLADASTVQNFPGVPARVEEIRALGAERVLLTGPIVDEQALSAVPPPYAGPDLLINLGGFKNFLLDYHHHNAYLRLFRRWIPDLLADWPSFERVSVCGGGYSTDRGAHVEVKGRTAEFGCLPQRNFLRVVASARHYMLTPGLTAIHESLILGRLPLAMPEQHYGHIVNLERLAGTLFHRLGSRFAAMIDDYEVPADDFAGTDAIVRQTGRLLTDDAGYARFRRAMNERIETFLGVDEATLAGGVAELRALLRGPAFAVVLAGILPTRFSRLAGEPSRLAGEQR
jgi:hypothetical protein